MAVVTSTLWQAELRDGTPVWLYEGALRRQRRRFLVAVDTSDSCAPEGDRLKSFFRMLVAALELGDSCALWLLGRREKALETVLTHYDERQRLAQNLAGSLTSVRGGTWLEQTLEAMLAEAADPTAADREAFLLLVSDGEVFDAESLLARQRPRLGFVRLGQRASPTLEVIESCMTVVAASEAALSNFLSLAPQRAGLRHGWRGARWSTFSDQGELLDELPNPGLPNDPLLLAEAQASVRVVFVGGHEPQPRLLYAAGAQAWMDTEAERKPLPPDAPARLKLVLRALQSNEIVWDWERLSRLAADDKKATVLDCRRCHRKKQIVRRKLFCDCQALLVARDGSTRNEALALYEDMLRFLINGDGTITGPAEAGCWETGDDAYALQEEHGQRWLVLNPYKS